MTQNRRKSPHVLLHEWYGRPTLDWLSVNWLTSQLYDLHSVGYSRDELHALLRDIETDLIGGKLTEDTDSVTKILGELRAADREIQFLKVVPDETDETAEQVIREETIDEEHAKDHEIDFG